MKKGKLLIVLLCVSTACMNVAVATPVQPKKPVHKNVTDNHKKNKAVPEHKITEKDIAECTSLINKVSQQEMTVIPVAIPLAAPNNTKIAEHLQKPADVQLFASDDPKAIAHLTGKTVLPPVIPVIKSAVTPPTEPSPSTFKSAVPEHVNKPTKPISTHQVTAAPATIKTTLNPKHSMTKSIEKAPAATVVKPLIIKTAPPAIPLTLTPAQPHIELFAPNMPDLDHLEGKSANLANLQPRTAAEHQKNKKLIHKKKFSSSSITRAKAKKEHS